MLNFIDGYNWEWLWIEVDTSLPSLRGIWILGDLVENRGKFLRTRVDKGGVLRQPASVWGTKYNITTHPTVKTGRNVFIERNNGILRRKHLVGYYFFSLQEIGPTEEEGQYD